MIQPQFTVSQESASASYAKFILEPLPQGYGQTLGNSLRRVLYSSIPGAAITSVTISGASHQFTTIDGVKEDMVQLILNLKLVRLSFTGDKPTKITLSAKGPGPVTAGQFETDASVKIANPDLVIASLADKSSKLELTATVESGLGYQPAEETKSTTVGVIPVDAVFTPVSRVNFSVESTRVGRLTNFDKLILEIHTDGTISPELALKTASSALVDYFSSIVSPQTAQNSGSQSSSHVNPGSSISIEELDLPTRISNALLKSGFEAVADLLGTPRAELAKVKNLGSKSVKIIELALRERGFELT